MMKRILRQTGFTLIEVLLASIIGSFVIIVAVGSLRAMSGNSTIIQSRIDGQGQLRFVINQLQCDLMNIVKDSDPNSIKFVAAEYQTDISEGYSLTFYAVNRVPARPREPEGDIYEVEYFTSMRNDKPVLMRRLWPYPPYDIELEQEEKSGVVSCIAENILAFNARYYDGEDWYPTWPAEMQGYPELVEVQIAFMGIDESDVLTDSFVINMPKLANGSANLMDQMGQGDGDSTEGSPEPQSDMPEVM